MSDARAIGYGGMIGEGALAVIATLAVASGLEDWSGHYHSWNEPGMTAIANFVKGSTTFLKALALNETVGATIVAVMVISFAATSLDTAARIQRHLVVDIGRTLEMIILGALILLCALTIFAEGWRRVRYH